MTDTDNGRRTVIVHAYPTGGNAIGVGFWLGFGFIGGSSAVIFSAAMLYRAVKWIVA